MNINFSLTRNAYGKLIFSKADDAVLAEAIPIRAFPIAAPNEGVSLLDLEGHELYWIAHLSDIPEKIRILIEEELASREFMPEITQIKSVSSFATPSTWQVETCRGATSFVLKGEEDIRSLDHATLMIADGHGIQFLIRDLDTLDRASRKLLDRFL